MAIGIINRQPSESTPRGSCEIDSLIIKGMGGYAEPVLNHFRSPFYVARYFTGTTRNQSSMEKAQTKRPVLQFAGTSIMRTQ